ncbi:hypothetical protein A2Z67_01955 [Candidatus Woesebacteria bacterium RBG_13_36_22]|uniref:SIS domain-containing protein n=1 Tax=Candidatus Woesebacteria bacterium RBG_13_36_22 TaxID=1802478 RepID=A0A1F7X6K3_9BACT|nr:MAG: hypothetical protein A2Z67_01955 [Candidatus Woesebacteria bacterium RBG_13_36_22]
MNPNFIPVTERSNYKTKDIDMLDAKSISRVLSNCEEEIFTGYESSRGIYNEKLLRKYISFSKKINQEIYENGNVNLILIGAGTSGRLCRLMAKVLSPLVEDKINIIPIIAGGIKALVRAEPNTEDKVEEGVSDYLNHTKNIDRSKCFVIGVSCGLSASYVKGALDEANKYSEGKTAIIGFNPIHLATVDLGKKIQILNPVIGPEPIVGSVRMKGGTTTMILIYALVLSSIGTSRNIKDVILNTFKDSKEALSKIRSYQEVIAQLINFGNKALQSGGSIYLLGSSSYGALCIYDAAECPPTFGAKIDQVNGYSQNGIDDLVYYPNEKKEVMAKEISLNIFKENTLLKLTKKDIALVIRNTGEGAESISEILKSKFKNLYLMEVISKGEKKEGNKRNRNVVFVGDWKNNFQKLLFIRSLLVQLSTGSFVLSGKVYENKMIDLRITNKKLFLRAIRIVSHITHKDKDRIKESLLKSIYEGKVTFKTNLEDTITLSASCENIVPLTILSLVYPEKSIESLRLMLKKEPIVRKLVLEELAKLK